MDGFTTYLHEAEATTRRRKTALSIKTPVWLADDCRLSAEDRLAHVLGCAGLDQHTDNAVSDTPGCQRNWSFMPK
jgi:hypothetical protein